MLYNVNPLFQRIASEVVAIYDSMLRRNNSKAKFVAESLPALDKDVYRDSDIPSRLPEDLKFSP